MKHSYDEKNLTLQLQLDEALQMLRLVATNKRTCLEVEEWLSINFPEVQDDDNTLNDLLKNSKTK